MSEYTSDLHKCIVHKINIKKNFYCKEFLYTICCNRHDLLYADRNDEKVPERFAERFVKHKQDIKNLTNNNELSKKTCF